MEGPTIKNTFVAENMDVNEFWKYCFKSIKNAGSKSQKKSTKVTKVTKPSIKKAGKTTKPRQKFY